MNKKLQSPLFWAAIIGAVKIVLDTVGIQIIDDQKIDALSNGFAAAAVLVGVVVDHGAVIKSPTMQEILDAITNLVSDLSPVVTPEVTQPVSSVAPQPDKIIEDKSQTS